MIDLTGLPVWVERQIDPRDYLAFYLEPFSPQAAEKKLEILQQMKEKMGERFYEVAVLVVWYNYTIPGAASYLGVPPLSEERISWFFGVLGDFSSNIEVSLKECTILGRFGAEMGPVPEAEAGEVKRKRKPPKTPERDWGAKMW